MALPPQAIEKLVREPSHTQGAYRELLLISAAVFGLAIVIYAGLAFGYRAFLESRLTDVGKQIADFSAGVSEDERKEIQSFYSQLVNLRTLIAGHTAATPLLALMERTVQPDIYYTKLTLNTNNDQAVLTGAAQSLGAIASQAAALQEQPEVSHLDFNNAGAQTGGPWQFTMTLYLKPEVFHGAIVSAPEVAAPTSTPVSSSTPQ